MTDGVARLLNAGVMERNDHDPPIRVAALDDDDVVEIFEALSGQSTCRIYQAIQNQPQTPPALQSEVGTSIQNVHYHLEKLEAANLIEAIGTQYSEKGAEMTVYGPTHQPLIISFAPEETTTDIRTAVTQLFAAIGVLGILSIAVQVLATTLLTGSPSPGDASGNVSTPTLFPGLESPGLGITSPGLVVFVLGLVLISTYFTVRLAANQR